LKIKIAFMPRFNYDEEADVMYISFGKPLKCVGKEMGSGMLHRYTLGDKLNGITIVNFKRRVN